MLPIFNWLFIGILMLNSALHFEQENNKPIKYIISCFSFLQPDPLHANAGTFEFANSNPFFYVDRDGQLPINITPGVEKSRAKKIFKLFKKLSSDKLEMRYNAQSHLHSIDVLKYAGQHEIGKPSGTRLIRDILAIRDKQLTIDYNNTLQIESNARLSPTTKDLEGTVQICYTGRQIPWKNSMGYEFHQKADVVINLNGTKPPGALYWDPRKNKVLLSDKRALFPKEMILFHEMIHAKNKMDGTMTFVRDAQGHYHYPMDESVNRIPYPESRYTENIPLEEARTIGLTTYSPRSAIEGVDLSYYPSENQLRREMRIPYRIYYSAFR